MTKNKRNDLVNAILIKNGDEDNDEERAFLELLPLPELEALASGEDELNTEEEC